MGRRKKVTLQAEKEMKEGNNGRKERQTGGIYLE